MHLTSSRIRRPKALLRLLKADGWIVNHTAKEIKDRTSCVYTVSNDGRTTRKAPREAGI
jgi:hypothetical protein